MMSRVIFSAYWIKKDSDCRENSIQDNSFQLKLFWVILKLNYSCLSSSINSLNHMDNDSEGLYR